jgi:RNA polymerase sigma-70 factor (ECF subfamily)
MADPDTSLMLAFCSGDTGAFRRLVERNTGIVFGLACRYLHDHADAEDVVQDVFLKVYNAAGNYQPTAKFTTWLYRITVNASLNRIRSRKKRSDVSLESGSDGGDAAFEPAAEGSEGPSSRLEHEELEMKVRQVMAQLPENQRTAVYLRRFEEMSYEEIAQAMETTVAAVKSLLARARQTLKSQLSKYL